MSTIDYLVTGGNVSGALFTSCTAQALPSLWNVPLELSAGSSGLSASRPVLRELGDGCLCIAYQGGDSALTADCYTQRGRLVRRVQIPLPDSVEKPCFHRPLFVSDDEIFWIGYDYADSLRLDLTNETVSRLAMPEDCVIPADTCFEVMATLLFPNGELVLAGGDLQPERYFRPRHARILHMDSAGTVQSFVEALDDTVLGNEAFSSLVPVHGTTRYLVQRVQRHADFSESLLTYQGDGASLQLQSEFHDRKILYADTRSVWFDELGLGVVSRGVRPEFSWMLPGVSLRDVHPTSDGQFLAIDHDEGQYRLLKIDATGAVQWSVDVTPGVGYKTVAFGEKCGQILVTQGCQHTEGALLSDQRQSPSGVLVADNRQARIQHRLLGLDGREVARFAEPGYDASFLRHPDRPQEFCEVRQFRPGSTASLGVTPLRNGCFVALSDWCGNDPFAEPEARMFYFGRG